jgi:hypothetical protein
MFETIGYDRNDCGCPLLSVQRFIKRMLGNEGRKAKSPSTQISIRERTGLWELEAKVNEEQNKKFESW